MKTQCEIRDLVFAQGGFRFRIPCTSIHADSRWTATPSSSEKQDSNSIGTTSIAPTKLSVARHRTKYTSHDRQPTNSLESSLADTGHVARHVPSRRSIFKEIRATRSSWRSTATKAVVTCPSFAFAKQREHCSVSTPCATGLRVAQRFRPYSSEFWRSALALFPCQRRGVPDFSRLRVYKHSR